MSRGDKLLRLINRLRRERTRRLLTVPEGQEWWVPFITVDAVHRYHCPSTRIGKKFGPCDCGAQEIQDEIDRLLR